MKRINYINFTNQKEIVSFIDMLLSDKKNTIIKVDRKKNDSVNRWDLIVNGLHESTLVLYSY